MNLQTEAGAHVVERNTGTRPMIAIIIIAVLGIVVLQASGSVPDSSVGGPMMIAIAFFGGALAVAIHEAWTQRRGAIGWIVNIVVMFVAALFAAQFAGFAMVMLVAPFGVQESLAATGGPALYVALAGAMVITLLGVWAALQLVNRWR